MEPKVNNLNWKIGGEAGYGIASAGEVFAYACAHGGLETFAYLEYPSLIRGGHNTYQVWAREDNVQSHSTKVDLLVALNKETIDKHVGELVPGGALVYDSDDKDLKSYACTRQDAGCFPVPLETLSKQAGGEKVMRNMVAVGASFGLTGFPFELLLELIARAFGKKGQKVIELNQAAAKAGYVYAAEHYQKDFGYRLEVREAGEKRMLVNGNEAVAMGALKAGMKLFAAYPMTPASSILHFLAPLDRQYGLVVKHTEDEIAAMNMIVGASFAGVRSMTATSGGGFSLMVEALGLAAITECPVVIVLAQRPGPATGLPTWSDQGDLRFALHAAQGEFPRFVLAPGDPGECFELGFAAHNLAEQFQVPAIILTDKYLGEARQTMPLFKADGFSIDRGKWADTSALPADARFARYADSPDGVSPRTRPGQPGGVYTANSDEHDDTGLANEDADVRNRMQERRFGKVAGMRAAVPEPVKLYGPKDADVTLVGWGSTKGPILEAMKELERAGKSVNFMQVRLLEPFPVKEVDAILRQAKRRVLVENNLSGQLGGLIREKTGIDISERLLKYDGRPIHIEEILAYANR